MTFTLRPMLAATVQPEQLGALAYPLHMQVKYDGIRAIAYEGKLVSRTIKPIRNRSLQNWFRVALELYPWLEHIDGELIVGDPSDPQCYHKTNSGVMSGDGHPDFSYYIFDSWRSDNDYIYRRQWLASKFDTDTGNSNSNSALKGEIGCRIKLASEWEVKSASDVQALYADLLSEGHEGAILRNSRGKYKFNRSTLHQQGMLKLKSFADSEAVVVDYGELMRNGNDATKDARGYTVRSSHQGNLVGSNMLGYLIVRSEAFNGHFKIGTGFDEATRIRLWSERETLKGRIVKFKYMPIGIKDLPRHPVFLGFRDPNDVG